MSDYAPENTRLDFALFFSFFVDNDDAARLIFLYPNGESARNFVEKKRKRKKKDMQFFPNPVQYKRNYNDEKKKEETIIITIMAAIMKKTTMMTMMQSKKKKGKKYINDFQRLRFKKREKKELNDGKVLLFYSFPLLFTLKAFCRLYENVVRIFYSLVTLGALSRACMCVYRI